MMICASAEDASSERVHVSYYLYVEDCGTVDIYRWFCFGCD